MRIHLDCGFYCQNQFESLQSDCLDFSNGLSELRWFGNFVNSNLSGGFEKRAKFFDWVILSTNTLWYQN
jgi:hypothetical protein